MRECSHETRTRQEDKQVEPAPLGLAQLPLCPRRTRHGWPGGNPFEITDDLRATSDPPGDGAEQSEARAWAVRNAPKLGVRGAARTGRYSISSSMEPVFDSEQEANWLRPGRARCFAFFAANPPEVQPHRSRRAQRLGKSLCSQLGERQPSKIGPAARTPFRSSHGETARKNRWLKFVMAGSMNCTAPFVFTSTANGVQSIRFVEA